MKKYLSLFAIILALSLPANLQASPFISKSAAKNIAKGAAATASLIVIMHGIKAYWVYYTYQQLPTCKEKINFLIQHKTFLKRLLTVRNCVKNIITATVGESLVTIKTIATNYLEHRLMKHLSNKNLNSIEDLPVIEQKIIKAVDGDSRALRILIKTVDTILDDDFEQAKELIKGR